MIKSGRAGAILGWVIKEGFCKETSLYEENKLLHKLNGALQCGKSSKIGVWPKRCHEVQCFSETHMNISMSKTDPDQV